MYIQCSIFNTSNDWEQLNHTHIYLYLMRHLD